MVRIAKNIKFDEVLKGISEVRTDLDEKNEITKILSVFCGDVCSKSFDEIEIPEFKPDDNYMDDEIEEDDNVLVNEDGDGESLLKCKYFLSEKDKKCEDERIKNNSICNKRRASENICKSEVKSYCGNSELIKSKSCHELSDGEHLTESHKEIERGFSTLQKYNYISPNPAAFIKKSLMEAQKYSRKQTTLKMFPIK